MSTANVPYRRPFRPCTISGCTKQDINRGLCATHNWRLTHHGDPHWLPTRYNQTCSVPDCNGKHLSLGYCVKHYSRFKKYGDPLGLAPPRLTPEARALRGTFDTMRQRCLNPKVPSYKRYGGRGIECRFKSAQELANCLGPRPSPKHSIDRINNDGHYEPNNVRWATQTEQIRNSRKMHRITFDGVTRTIQEWSEFTGIGYRALVTRISRKWCVKCTLTKPVVKRRSLPSNCPHARELKELIR